MGKANPGLLRQYRLKYDLYQAEAEKEAQKLEAASESLKMLEKKRDKLKEKIERIDNELRSDAVRVTDHAVLQYLQRYCGVDVEGIRQSLLPPKNSPLYESMRQLKSATVNYTLPDTGVRVRLRLQLGAVVTVLPPLKAAG